LCKCRGDGDVVGDHKGVDGVEEGQFGGRGGGEDGV
jgi:hypothetical protein